MHTTISSKTAIEKIINKFLCIVGRKENIDVSKADGKYFLKYDGYMLVVEEDDEDDDHLLVSFYGTGEELCHYNVNITKDEHLYAQISDRLLVYCDDELQYARKMMIVQEFLDNH